jgi:DNA-binding NarL/FixJ family response regulator
MDAGAAAQTTPPENHGPAAVRLFVVARSELFRLGLSRLLLAAGIKIVGEASDLARASMKLPDSVADVVLVESSPSPAAVDALRTLVRSVPQRAVVLIQTADDRSLLEALAAGACCSVDMNAREEEIVAAIRAAGRGERFVSPTLARRLTSVLGLSPGSAPPPAAELTSREREVLDLIARGWDNGKIAQELFVSPATIKRHTSSIFGKLGVANRVQAAVRAVQDGLLDRPV